jgi:hypothetical protein
MKQIFLPLTVLAFAAVPLSAHAATCRDAHGRFVSCAKSTAAKPATQTAATRQTAHKTTARRVAATAAPHKTAKTAAKHCKIGNRFASCSAPGAKPV